MTKPRTVAAALAAAIAFLAVGPASPADASIGSMSAQLSISKSHQRYSVQVAGVVPMTRAEAQQLIASGHRVVWRGWGSDPASDDFLFGPDPASLTATSRGLEFSGARVTTGAVLDEDDSWTDERDEVYAGVRLLRPGGSTLRSDETNQVRGWF